MKVPPTTRFVPLAYSAFTFPFIPLPTVFQFAPFHLAMLFTGTLPIVVNVPPTSTPIRSGLAAARLWPPGRVQDDLGQRSLAQGDDHGVEGRQRGVVEDATQSASRQDQRARFRPRH